MSIAKAKKTVFQSGFTLLEMLVVIGLVGVLAAIALARYDDHILASNRQAARAALLQAQQTMERHFLQNGTYVGAVLPAAQLSDPFVLALVASTPLTYTVTAAPGRADPCGNLTIDQAGVRGATLAATPQAVINCWQ
jgi:type IV pilus assembly protein PilE